MDKKMMIPHIIQEGSRQHVISYDSLGRHCSEPNCEINFELAPQSEPSPEPMPLSLSKLEEALMEAARYCDENDLSLEDEVKRFMDAVSKWELPIAEAMKQELLNLTPAHDQQVRKAFAEQIIEQWNWKKFGLDKVEYETCIAHLRAMAGER